jgi:S1-C subfamily serine protease
MPDAGTEFSRLCPSCGRRVPRGVATCRCGASLAAVSAPAVEATREATSPFSAVLIIIVALAAAGGALYWSLSRPAAPAPDAADSSSPAEPAADSVAGSRPAEPSAERRAWDASVAANPRVPAPADTPAAAREAAPVAPASAASIEDMVSRVMPAVVLVESSSGRGSGFFVRHDTVITNVHVVRSDTSVTLIQTDGSKLRARVESRAPAFDIAVLKVVTPAVNQPVIALGSARTLRAGQEVIIIGSALGVLQNSVSRGIVSGVRENGAVTLVQTDAAANPGNSGGPLLDRNGTAIGITTLGYTDRQGLNFAVAIDHARDILDGRSVTPPAGSLTLENMRQPGAAAAGSEADRRQENGERAFHAALTALAQAAGELDVAWRRFKTSCYNSTPIVGSFDREWFAVYSPQAMTAPIPAHCLDYFASFKVETSRFSQAMGTALGQARRAGVLPGVVRDGLRERRLQYDGWDR